MDKMALRNQILEEIMGKMKNSLANKMYPEAVPTMKENDDTHAQADPAISEPEHLAEGGPVVEESEPVIHEAVEHEPMHEVTDPEEKELLEKLMAKHFK